MKITINETKLKNLVLESIKKILREGYGIGHVDVDDTEYSFDDFLESYRYIEAMYLKPAEEVGLQEFYKHLLEEWENEYDDEYRSQFNGGFKEFCESIVADMLREKYGSLIK